MKIGIFGGSFNPVHKGHIAVAEYALKHLELDKLFFVPAFKNPFKSTIKYVSPEHRVAMLKLVLPNKCEVSMFEISRAGISYSIDTVNYFSQKFPNDSLFLIIGSDNVEKLNKWKNIDEIAKKVKISVFARDKVINKQNIKKYKALLFKNEVFDFSSSSFRQGVMENVDEKIQQYVAKNFLFVPDLMINMLDAKRHKHSISVGQYAAKYAKILKYDAQKAWFAGSMHDITKSWPKQKHYDFLQLLGKSSQDILDHELHSLTSYLWLKFNYLCDDEEILNSVLRHTSLAPEITTLDKIIFAADKVCDGRKFDGIQKVRNLLEQDFEKGFSTLLQKYLDDLKVKRNISVEQEAIYRRHIHE